MYIINDIINQVDTCHQYSKKGPDVNLGGLKITWLNELTLLSI